MKKLLILFLAVSLLASSLVTVPCYAAETQLYSTGTAYICGDADGDGVVTVIDAILAARHATNLITLNEAGLKAADVNADGSVNIADSVMVAKYCAGMITTFPAETECIHNYSAVVTVPGCEAAGYTTYTCSACGDSYTGDAVSALGHDYVETVVSPTCTESGSVTTSCSRCDYEETVPTLALGHDLTTVVTDATCTQMGTVKTSCSRCDYKTIEENAALGHSYNAVVTAPTCEEAGYTTYTCSICGDSYTGDAVSALGHDYNETVVSPTCTEAGSVTTTCSRCDYKSVTETAALGHSYDSVVTSPTETAQGYTTYTCSNCGDSYVSDYVDALNPDTLPFTVTCLSGTADCYTYDGTTLTFGAVTEESVYSISGELQGNIVLDTGDDYKFDLEMHGFTLTSADINPITVLSGDEVSVKAKKGYDNFIYDNREVIDSTDTTLYSAAVYSLVDLELAGKGNLTLISKNNNGFHTKDDLQVKNLTLSVTCADNALKGNDSVEITSAVTTLIATKGDCIKTTNSHINETTGNQKGTVIISGGTHNLYAACDGIDAAYNAQIDDETTVLNIYTDKYSQYSEEVTDVAESTYYLRYTSTAYKFSVRYSNSSTGEYEWVNVSDSYETVTSSSNRPGGSGSTYYYYTFAKLSGYDKLAVYMYSSGQEQGQSNSYYACSSEKAVNDSYDTISLSYRSNSLSVSWTNYGTTSGNTGGMGGNEGNTDKGEYSTKGIKAANEITINGGTINIEAYDDAIHANNDGGTLENGEAPTGNVTINGGTITIYTNDDGLHADGTMTVVDGTVSISNAYEGVEGAFIVVSGGAVSVVSKDDGFNGTSTQGAAITISGGEVYVYAGGDGIDSNSTTSKGAIIFSGGNVVVIGTSGGNSAIDSDGGYTHSAGNVLAIMPTGGMTSESTNGNTVGRTTKSSLSLSNGGYVTVSVSGTSVVDVKMPASLSAFVVYLGSSNATISSASSSSGTFNANGVCWY